MTKDTYEYRYRVGRKFPRPSADRSPAQRERELRRRSELVKGRSLPVQGWGYYA